MKDDEIARRFGDIAQGFSHMTGEVTLATTPETTTTVERRGVSSNGVVVLVPINSAAAAEVGGTALYNVPATDQFVINHSASASARIFRWVAFRGPSIPF